eukprot:TRINITY_DN5942_c0_g1_i1.p1 TRINITY_DN5942_c0_g1~~TRINITY_DN5942_c0_g1_i1.p1  ORF type:complete len:166 (-),score=25.62 TRINITY_DN5942_c0_g1_i1:85-582(-)
MKPTTQIKEEKHAKPSSLSTISTRDPNAKSSLSKSVDMRKKPSSGPSEQIQQVGAGATTDDVPRKSRLHSESKKLQRVSADVTALKSYLDEGTESGDLLEEQFKRSLDRNLAAQSQPSDRRRKRTSTRSKNSEISSPNKKGSGDTEVDEEKKKKRENLKKSSVKT